MKKTDHNDNTNFCVNKLIQFCKRTDLHGYKYIVMEELSGVERCCWAASVAISVILAAYFVVTAYTWYARNPIVTVIESTHGAIWDVPFPSVTICDLNLVSRRAARNFADNATLPPNVTGDEVFEILRFAPLLTSPHFVNDELKERLYILQDVLDLNQMNPRELFEKVNHRSCSELIQKCMWKNTLFRCERIFHRLFTHYSICCVFNSYAIDTTGDLNSIDPFLPKKPRRVASCGYQSALTALVQIDIADYYSTSAASFGVLVIIDNAYNLPGVNSPSRLVNPGSEVFIALSPERTYSTPGVARFGVDIRQCFYADEVKIDKFKYYSYHNCLTYENALDMKYRCGCVPHYFILKEKVRICNFRDISCLQNIKRPYNASKRSDMENKRVNCLPDCEHYDYLLQVAMGELSKHPPPSSLVFFKDIELRNQSVVNVFFNDLVSTRYRRDVYLNWQNLLASFGGLLSLMLGFTVISGFDLIIFFTFKLPYDLWIVLKNTKQKSKVSTIKESNAENFYVGGRRIASNWMGHSRNNVILTRNHFIDERGVPPSYDAALRY